MSRGVHLRAYRTRSFLKRQAISPERLNELLSGSSNEEYIKRHDEGKVPDRFFDPSPYKKQLEDRPC